MEGALVSEAMQKALFPKADQGGESMMYETKVKKFNRYNISQDRILVLSKEFLYLLGSSKIHTKIGIGELSYIIKCLQSSEIVLFFVNNIDIRMSFMGDDPEEEREMFLSFLKARFVAIVQNRTLKFYGINEPNLKNYKSGGGFKSSAYNLAPPEELRLKDEEYQSEGEH